MSDTLTSLILGDNQTAVWIVTLFQNVISRQLATLALVCFFSGISTACGQFLDKSADLNSLPTVLSGAGTSEAEFSVEQQQDRLCISLGKQLIVDFVFRDPKILRPYFANARLSSGLQGVRICFYVAIAVFVDA
ncbi:MAG: hypothetical protein Q8M16_07265 [Pirellulaceae bacterium]|nr:hypothetical protein [Pirellulaceae bacterium]